MRAAGGAPLRAAARRRCCGCCCCCGCGDCALQAARSTRKATDTAAVLPLPVPGSQQQEDPRRRAALRECRARDPIQRSLTRRHLACVCAPARPPASPDLLVGSSPPASLAHRWRPPAQRRLASAPVAASGGVRQPLARPRRPASRQRPRAPPTTPRAYFLAADLLSPPPWWRHDALRLRHCESAGGRAGRRARGSRAGAASATRARRAEAQPWRATALRCDGARCRRVCAGGSELAGCGGGCAGGACSPQPQPRDAPCRRPP